MGIILQFFPNGEFSQGVDTSKKRRDKQRKDTPTQTLPLDTKRRYEYLQYASRVHPSVLCWAMHPLGTKYSSPNLYTYTLRESSETHCVLEWGDVRGTLHRTTCSTNIAGICFQWRLTPLVHQLVESSKPASSRKKLEGMTKNMARNIRQGVFLLEECEGGKDVLSFLTLTLPNLSREGLASCCEQWDYMVNRFLCWLRSKVENEGVKFQYVYCTEIQSKRLQQRGEYAPHLHIVFRGRIAKKFPWIISPRQARQAWKSCISSVVSESFDSSALENIQRIKYSAARYLSKYLSKGKNCLPSGTDEDVVMALRTQWGGMARDISQRIRQKTIKLSGDRGHGALVVYILDRMEALVRIGLVRYFKKGFISLGIDRSTGVEYGLHVGCGCLSTPTHQGGYEQIMGTI